MKAISCLLAVAILCFSGEVSVSDQTKPKGKTVDEILALPDDQIDLETAVLLFSKEGYKKLYNTDIDVEKYRQMLNTMAQGLSKKTEREKDPEKIIGIMNDYIFQEQKFSVDKTDPEGANPLNLFLNSVLDRKKGLCASLTILYLCLAERINFPLHGVCAPGHFFVRYEDGLRRINIETTGKGKPHGDDFYIEKSKIPEDSPFYLKRYGKKEIIGGLFNNLGLYYIYKGMPDEATFEFKKALAINPNDAAAHCNLGGAYGEKGMPDEAISESKKALAINPNEIKAHCNLGAAYGDKGMLDEGISELKKALAINPNCATAHGILAEVYYLKKEYKLAIDHCDKSIELGWRVHPDLLEELAPYR